MRFVDTPVTRLDAYCRSCGRDFEALVVTAGSFASAIGTLSGTTCPHCRAGTEDLELGVVTRTIEHDRWTRRKIPPADVADIWRNWRMNGIHTVAGDAACHRILDLGQYPGGFESGPETLGEVRALVLLSDRLPEIGRRLAEMADVSPRWAAYVEGHEALVAKLFEEAGPNLGPAATPESGRMFERIREDMYEALLADRRGDIIRRFVGERAGTKHHDTTDDMSFEALGLTEGDVAALVERTEKSFEVSVRRDDLMAVGDLVEAVEASVAPDARRFAKTPVGGWWTGEPNVDGPF